MIGLNNEDVIQIINDYLRENQWEIEQATTLAFPKSDAEILNHKFGTFIDKFLPKIIAQVVTENNTKIEQYINERFQK